MTPNPRSDGLPQQAPEQSTLFLTTPLAQTEQRLRNALQQLGLELDEPFPGVLRVRISSNQLQQLALACIKELNRVDLQLTKCRLDPIGIEPSQSDLMQTTMLSNLIDWIDSQWLEDLLKDQRLATYFQPIVHTTSPGEIFAYECLLRGLETDAALITPDRLFGAARAGGKLAELDQNARLMAIQSAAQRGIDTRIFVNFSPRSISDPQRCLESTVAATTASGIAHEQFVFEVVESDEIADMNDLLKILNYFRDAGYGVALDDLGAGYSSLNLMAELKPDFIKLDMGLIRNVDKDLYKSRVASKLLELARELDVKTVVEGVETVGEWQWVLEHGADFAQGYLFARPRFIPPKSQFRGDHTNPPEIDTAALQQDQLEDTAAMVAAVGLTK